MTTQEAPQRAKWSGKWAFILSAAASAVGLGNLWRFPYLAAKYGGGTFLLTYFVLVFTFGLSLLLLEIAFGRKTRLSVFSAFRSYGKKYAPIGFLAVVVPFIITPYYCIIGGWVTKYLTAYVTNSAASIADVGGESGAFFTGFITSPVASQVFMLVFMAITVGVVALGVKNGIEKANFIMMPALIVMAIAIAIFTVLQPGAAEGVAYYLCPDFSKFSPELVINALGQMFYSLSLAMAIMITYGSYVDKKDNLPTSAARIVSFDFIVSFLAGIMIVPGAFIALGSADAVAAKAGPSLMFVTLPQVFSDMGFAGQIVGFVFFLLVLFAALTSAISLTEACVSNIQDATSWSRKKSLAVFTAFLVVCGLVVNAGYSGLSFIQPLGEGSTLLDFFDFISNSVLMPIVAICTCIFVGFIIKPQAIIDEIRQSSTFGAAGAWAFMIKFVAPVLVAIILITNILPYLGIG